MFRRLFLFLKIHLIVALDREKQTLIRAGLAQTYRGRLIPIMRGAERDGMFPELPKDLSTLTDEELSALKDEYKAVAKLVKDRDEDTLGDLTAEQIIAEMTAGVEAIEQIDAELTGRAEAQDNFDKSVAELAARAGAEDPEAEGDDGEGDGDDASDSDDSPAEGETAEAEARELEPVAASARVRRALPMSRRHRPQENAQPQGAQLLAARDVYPFAERGEALNTRRLGEVMTEMVKKNRIQPGQKIVVASATFDYPEERHLTRDQASNIQKIEAVTSTQALVASGGLCAPLTPIYDFPDIETAARPVRDALVNFRADRGGVIVGANPSIVDYADAVGTVTAEDDAMGGTFAVKNCMRIDCPDFTSYEVDSFYHCIEAGNLTARAYPELMSRIDVLVRANQARLADGALLTAIKAGSTAITDVNTTATAGAVWKLVEFAQVAAAGYRSRNRMSRDATLQALFPEWILDQLVVDNTRGQFERYRSKAEMERVLTDANITVTYYLDGPSTGDGMVFGAQNAGNLLPFPATCEWALYAPGSWLHLDSGVLELGIVRDSTLNSTNDFQIFGETWETAVPRGVESLWITSTLAPNGTQSAPKDFSAATNF